MRKILLNLTLVGVVVGQIACGGGRASVAEIGKAMSKPDATVDATTTKAALTSQDNQSSGGGLGALATPPSLGFIEMPEAAIPAFVATNGASLFSAATPFAFEQICAGAKGGKTSLKQAFEAASKLQNNSDAISGDITIEVTCPTPTSFKWEFVYDAFSMSATTAGASYKFSLDGNMVWSVGTTKVDNVDALYYRWASKLTGSATEGTKTTDIKFFGGAGAIATFDATAGYKVLFAGAVAEVNGKFLLFYYRDNDGNGRTVSVGSGYAIVRGGNGSYVFYGEGSKGERKFCIWSATTAKPPVLTYASSEGLTQAECDGKASAAGNLNTAFDVCATYKVLCE